MKAYNLGSDANVLEILVRSAEVNSHFEIRRGNAVSGVRVKMAMYDLEDVLCQMMEDYGAEELISRIQKLNS